MTYRDAVGTMLTGFAQTLANPRQVDNQLVATWCEALRDLEPTESEIKAAYLDCIRACEFFPTPKVVRAAIAEARASNAAADPICIPYNDAGRIVWGRRGIDLPIAEEALPTPGQRSLGPRPGRS